MNLINFLLTDIGVTIVWIEVTLVLWLLARYFFEKGDDRDLAIFLCFIWPFVLMAVALVIVMFFLDWLMELRLDFWRKK